MESNMNQRHATTIVREGLAPKDSLIPPQHVAAYNRAEKVWGNKVSTQAEKQAVIEAAVGGDELATLYLLKLMFDDGNVKKLLWSFLGPNTSFQRKRIAQGDTAIYRSIVAEALHKALEYWDASKATQDGDFFNSLKWHVTRSISTMITKYNTEQNRGGIAGKILKTDVKPEIGSYEAYTDNHDIESSHNQFRGTEDLDAWGIFVNDAELDNGRAPTTREVLKYFLNRGDFDVNAAAAEFGKTNMTIRTKLSSMKDILEKHSITYDTFQNLLKTAGPKDLANTL